LTRFRQLMERKKGPNSPKPSKEKVKGGIRIPTVTATALKKTAGPERKRKETYDILLGRKGQIIKKRCLPSLARVNGSVQCRQDRGSQASLWKQGEGIDTKTTLVVMKIEDKSADPRSSRTGAHLLLSPAREGKDKSLFIIIFKKKVRSRCRRK